MAFRNQPQELTVPGEAGPGEARIVITREVPQELQDAFLQPIESAILFYFEDADNDSYSFIVNESVGSGGSWQIHMGMVNDGVVRERQKWKHLLDGSDHGSSELFGNVHFNRSATETGDTDAGGAWLSIQHDATFRGVLWWRLSGGYDTNLYRAGAGHLKTDHDFTVNGLLTAGSIATGTVSINPVADTPTSATISGLNVQGTTFTAFANAHTTVPGSSVVEVSTLNQDSGGVTVYLYRKTTTTTTVSWLIIGQ